TKTVPFVQDGRKVYRFTVRWGVETDSDDAEGKVVATSGVRPAADAVAAVLPDFTGEIMQKPPVFSALKIDGQRAYDLARSGETVELEDRPVSIHRLMLVEAPDTDHAVFEAECGKGTYVRALARDIGRRLGCLGHVVALRRMVVGPFDETSMVPLARLIDAREAGDAQSLDAFLAPVGFALGELPEIAVNQSDAARIGRGQSVLIRGRDAPLAAPAVQATFAGRSLAVGEISEGAFHPKRVFRA
ncbi:MAG TPA: tRNA pseudouridine(55) synthase TruB, partial [Bauldia sp.]|nr:tRNA pseudouridine(55) synthase TruB [Bauldia sp.]